MRVAIIGGSGFDALESLRDQSTIEVSTQFGEPSASIVQGHFAATEILFLPRHGREHEIPPHLVNYRANLWALQSLGAEVIISLAAVGGINHDCRPGKLVIPDQILDYTYGREHTYCDDHAGSVEHIEFTHPYCREARAILVKSAQDAGLDVIERATYAAVQGPRFESAAEIRKLERDGADIIGMTGMPEASLARELGLCYAAIAIVVNRAAGKGNAEISKTEIDTAFAEGTESIYRLLNILLPLADRLEFAPVPSISA